jgi:hypothetical protein
VDTYLKLSTYPKNIPITVSNNVSTYLGLIYLECTFILFQEITVEADASMEVVEVVMRDPHPHPVVDTNVVVDAEEVAVVEEVRI